MEKRVRPDVLGIAQFLHPGHECSLSQRVGWVEWNRSGMASNKRATFKHHRKFMIADADWIHPDGSFLRGPIGFWGEWEAQSLARRVSAALEGHPTQQHVPALQTFKPTGGEVLADTDPFVFGNAFYYSGCQQHTANGRERAIETFLRRMAAGSMILFGSGIGRRFILDTVFVVGSYVDRKNGSMIDDQTFNDVTLAPQAGTNLAVDKFRLYAGATLERSFDGMFSFTPCVAYRGKKTGFARPALDLPGIVTHSMTQGKKLTVATDGAHVKRVWKAVVEQVRGAGLGLAHHVDCAPIAVTDVPHLDAFRDREDQQTTTVQKTTARF